VLIGASVLCFLVLMALFADRFGSRLFQSGDRVFYRCDGCDLRYVRRELTDPRLQVCPEGHRVVEDKGSNAGLVTIFVCVGFLTAALLMIVTGIVPQ